MRVSGWYKIKAHGQQKQEVQNKSNRQFRDAGRMQAARRQADVV